MKFSVTCTSTEGISPKPQFVKGKNGEMINGDRVGYIPDRWVVEIANLEELLQFIRSIQDAQRYDFGGVIMSAIPEDSEIQGTIESYDNYRE